ncbi:MAG TPA: hypothetical protein VEZ90_12975 [Blastocatellia bacterium]|nr:hypothetical protein [Blastocatellia bacterium]
MSEESGARIGVSSPVLVATWSAGLFVVSGGTHQQEMANHSVRALAPDGHGGALAIVDGGSLCRRAPTGDWSTVATTEMNLACCVAVGDVIYAGTDDATVLRVSAAGEIEQLRGFEQVAGRDKWYAGTALIDGKLVGPPLGVRSITATSDGAVLLANVHVGGIPRSADRGATWQPTIEIESDVHEVRAHPNRPGIVAAAAAIGLCTSSDGGATWEVEQRGLHALHCSAVAFAGDDILVSASAGPFAPEGAIYRRSVDERCSLVAVTGAGGLPAWLDGRADTGCIAANGSAVAVADAKGNLHVSADNGRTWSPRAEGLPAPSSILIV